MLLALQRAGTVQLDCFADAAAATLDPIRERLMATVDAINRRQGRGAVRFAGEGCDRPWAMRSKSRTPCYTTRWEELAVARA
jgi:DNA polymerase V